MVDGDGHHDGRFDMDFCNARDGDWDSKGDENTTEDINFEASFIDDGHRNGSECVVDGDHRNKRVRDVNQGSNDAGDVDDDDNSGCFSCFQRRHRAAEL